MARLVITLDTSGLLAAIRRQDPHHAACLAVLGEDRGPYLLSTAILGEIAWMIETMLPFAVQSAFLRDLGDAAYTLSWEDRDIRRIKQLTERYRDLPLGISDAAVVACAERHGGRVLSTDWRHFSVVARGEGTITVLPIH